MSQSSAFKVTVGVLIPSPTTNYQVQRLLGSGAYGVVLQCKNMTTNETVVFKMIKSQNNDPGENEEAVLQNMAERHSKFYILKLNESFTFRGHYCLVFEHLDMELLKFMRSSPGQHRQLKQIRPILQQLATSLEFLKSAGIIHTDLKPYKIMSEDHFGVASKEPAERTGEIIQPLWYRPPEVVHENPFSEAINIWFLGCIAIELFTGTALFRTSKEAELKRLISNAVGEQVIGGSIQPHKLLAKPFLECRFMATNPFWNGEAMAEHCDMEWFLDLLSQMMMKSQHKIITPSRILQHPFITMSHLKASPSFYARSSKDMMNICQDKSSNDGGRADPVDEDSSSSTAEKHSGSQTSTITRLEESKMTAEHVSATGERTDGQTVQIKHQMKRCDPTSSDKPSTKKRKTEFQKELSEAGAAPSNSQTSTITGAEKGKMAAQLVSVTKESRSDQIKHQIKRSDLTSNGKPSTKNMGLQKELSESEAAASNSQTCTFTGVRKKKMTAEHDNRLDNCQADMRSKPLATTGKGTSCQMGPPKRQRKSMQHDPMSSGKPFTKKRSKKSEPPTQLKT